MYVKGVGKIMTITVTKLRQSLFNEIDKVIATGQPIEIERKGHRLQIVLAEKKSKLSALVTRENIIACSDDELIYNDWLKGWKDDISND
jgi:hypothetical protein